MRPSVRDASRCSEASAASDPSDHLPMCGEPEDDCEGVGLDRDHAFLWRLCWQTTAAASLEFAGMGLVFVLVVSGLKTLAAIAAAMVLGSAMFQLWTWRRILSFLHSHTEAEWQEYILHLDSSAVCWCFPALWLQICLAFPETVDPPMDAWTAATARSICGAGCSHIFQESWADVPFGEFLGWMGLSGILTTLLCLSTMFQLVSVLLQTWGCLQKIDNMRDCAPYKHADDGAYRRWAVWVRMHHIADLGGFILLQKTYEKLVVVETQRSARIWPVADRNASFRAKICAESLPALWFQVSVFCLNFETASRVNLGTTLFSIVTGCSVRLTAWPTAK
ncbi:unnamed protein product [Effrenium voratum]|nr:unnamed protein product [Effrenium voratum]